MRPALCLLLAFAACDPTPCAEGGDCSDAWWQDAPLVHPYTVELKPEDGLGGMALALPELVGAAGMRSWWIEVALTNLAEDADCVALLYLGEEEPGPDALWEPDPADDPPEAVDGLGELIVAKNLTRAWGGVEQRARFVWESTEGDWGGVALPRYLSLVSCANPSLRLELEVGGLWFQEEIYTYDYDAIEEISRLW